MMTFAAIKSQHKLVKVILMHNGYYLWIQKVHELKLSDNNGNSFQVKVIQFIGFYYCIDYPGMKVSMTRQFPTLSPPYTFTTKFEKSPMNIAANNFINIPYVRVLPHSSTLLHSFFSPMKLLLVYWSQFTSYDLISVL